MSGDPVEVGLFTAYARPAGAEDELAVLLLESGLRSRAPQVRVRVFVPGPPPAGHALASFAVEPLAPADPGRREALAARLRAVVVSGAADAFVAAVHAATPDGRDDDLLRLALGDLDVPVAWHAVTGTDALPGWAGEIAAARPTGALPPPALLAPRAFAPDDQHARREVLRSFGWWPATDAPVLLVDVDDRDRHARAVRERAAAWDGPVVVRDADAHDLPDAWHRFGEHATARDLVAGVAGAAAIVTDRAVVADLARAYARPCAAPGDTDDPAVPPAPTASEVAHLDAEYDRLVALVGDAPGGPFTGQHVRALRDALDARGRRLAAERSALADRLWSLQRAHDERVAELVAERDAVRARHDALARHLEVRARAGLGRLRRRLRRNDGDSRRSRSPPPTHRSCRSRCWRTDRRRSCAT
jgi:hypothetical protein